MDKILREMERADHAPPVFGRVARALWELRHGTHDLTGPGGLLPVHLGPRSLLRREP